MSLLMDALKKAEEEKKRAAKRLEQVESDARKADDELGDEDINSAKMQSGGTTQTSESFTETAQLSLEPITSPVDETINVSLVNEDEINKDEQSIEKNEVKLDDELLKSEKESFTEGLTLENDISSEVLEETQKDVDLNDTTIIEGLSAEDVSAPFDDTFHGVLLEDEAPNADIYEETLPGVSADQLVKDLGDGEFQPTPVAAQTVFTANSKHKPGKSSFAWGALIVLGVLALVSFSIFYYFTITPVTRSLPSPIVARGIESTPVPVFNNIEKPETITGTIISDQSNKPDLVLEENTIEDQVTLIEQESESSALEPNPITETEIAETEVQEMIEEVVPNELILNDKPLSVTEVVDKNELIEEENETKDTVNIKSEIATHEESIQKSLSYISISKNKAPEKHNEILRQAFEAYNLGNYEASKSLYQGILKKDKDNRDARLGLAAIALNGNDRASAYKHYTHLLQLNPSDALALNYLISLSNSDDPIADESAIKLLLRKEGDVPYLYFSLGNLYAKQQRWPEAQKAFFDAYRLDTLNPDYVFNLAISLDHLGQYSTALDFYKTAIDLTKDIPARFDSGSVSKRIVALTKISDSKP